LDTSKLKIHIHDPSGNFPFPEQIATTNIVELLIWDMFVIIGKKKQSLFHEFEQNKYIA